MDRHALLLVAIALLLPGAAAQDATVTLPPTASTSPPDPLSSIQFPVAELDGCADRDACASYCDSPSNYGACATFAESHGLSHSDVGARLAFPIAELGACANAAECRVFCDEPANFVACIDFAEANTLIPPDEIDKARRAIPLLLAGDAPGGCRSENECLTYCADPARIEECVGFAESVGLISAEEAAAARAIAEGGGPGGCQSKIACMSFCDDPENRRACFDFAVEHALVSAEEAEMGRRFLEAGGVGPAGCASKIDCLTTCDDPANFDACIDFARDMGAIDDADWQAAQIIRDSGGPGNCMTKEQCEAYCSDPARFTECASAFGASKTAMGGAVPQVCVDQGLGPAECATLCADNAACVPAGEVAQGAIPPPCADAGMTTPEACARYCGTPPFPCGGAPSGGEVPGEIPGGVPPVGEMPPACAGLDVATCVDLCDAAPELCGALPGGDYPEWSGLVGDIP